MIIFAISIYIYLRKQATTLDICIGMHSSYKLHAHV